MSPRISKGSIAIFIVGAFLDLVLISVLLVGGVVIGSVTVPARGRLEADAREIGGLPERVGGVGEALDAAHVRVLVLDVDGDGGVDVAHLL